MDPFEVRMQFISNLKKLNAWVNGVDWTENSLSNVRRYRSQQSIQKCVGYALKYYPRCGEDIWSCIIDECRDVSRLLFLHRSLTLGRVQGGLNTRINVLYLLDTLCESSLQTSNNDHAQGRSVSNGTYYIDFISRDLDKIIEHVVPDSKDGLMNVQSTSQVRITLFCSSSSLCRSPDSGELAYQAHNQCEKCRKRHYNTRNPERKV